MSRCFPYPSPAYTGKCASNQALICTIKLQRDCDKTKSEKKDRRKEKKEKKRKDKSNGTVSKENKKALPMDEKLYSAGKSDYSEVCNKTKPDSAYDNNIERSSLTEEHGKPCCSSDSTENSGKRKRQSSPQASNNTRNSGNVIRIVLSSQKKEDRPIPSSSNNSSLSLPAGKLNSLSKKSDVEVKPASNLCMKGNLAPLSKKADVEAKHLESNLRITPPKNIAAQQLNNITSNKEKLAPLFKKTDVVVKPLALNLHITAPKRIATQHLTFSNPNKEKASHPDKKIEQGSTSKAEKKLPRPLRKYQALFENWAPLPMEVDTVDDEEDWLFGSSSKKEECQTAKRMKYCTEEVLPSCGSASILQPQALLLSDVDLYALPFTVPF